MKAFQVKSIACRVLLVATLGAASSCSSTEKTATSNAETTGAATPCATGKVVRTVTKARGFISFDKATGQYRITAPAPGTVDEVAVGVLCQAPAAALRAEGTKVVFSGTYREYPAPPAAPAGYTQYYLEVSSINAE